MTRHYRLWLYKQFILVRPGPYVDARSAFIGGTVTHIRGFLMVALTCGGALAFTSCGSDKPASPTPPTTQPAPAPSPTPTPTATPSVSQACAGAPATGSPKVCWRRPDPQLLSQLGQVLDGVRAQKDIFYPNGVTIRYLARFRQAVIDGLDARGLCGIFDYGDNAAGPGDELYVRTADNRLSEAYDVITGSGQSWTGYQNSCEPASQQPAFQPNVANKDPGCSLPPSRETFCLDRAFDSEYFDDVRSSIVAVTTEQPELFDLSDRLNSELSYRLLNPPAYIAAVVAKLRTKGYCAVEDGELSVKKDDTVNENFDIVRSPGNNPYQYSLFSYKGRCHNSLF